MILVVDSGSTKADWALIHTPQNITYTHTMGFNPYFHSAEKINAELSKKTFTEFVPLNAVKEIFYYGAGCPDEAYRSIIKSGLQLTFPNAIISVEHDLLGAARATCGKSPGIAGILGTGSNSCAYDGANIVDNVTALGHVLGDDGGGVHLGKLILQAHFYRELPTDLEKKFNQDYPEGNDAIIHRIYGDGQNVHIAHFAQFLIRNKEHSYSKKLIQQAFREFAQRHIKKYENWQKLPINLVGSIAEILKDDLQEVFQSEGLNLGRIVRKPIENLVHYHLN